MSTVDLNNFDQQPTEVQQAIAFYVGYSLQEVQATVEERLAHYTVLEKFGLLEPLNP
jgi:hypothetical protein